MFGTLREHRMHACETQNVEMSERFNVQIESRMRPCNRL